MRIYQKADVNPVVSSFDLSLRSIPPLRLRLWSPRYQPRVARVTEDTTGLTPTRDKKRGRAASFSDNHGLSGLRLLDGAHRANAGAGTAIGTNFRVDFIDIAG